MLLRIKKVIIGLFNSPLLSKVVCVVFCSSSLITISTIEFSIVELELELAANSTSSSLRYSIRESKLVSSLDSNIGC